MKNCYNICIATQQLKNIVSGVGTYSNSLVNQLVQGGHQVTVIGPEDERPEGSLAFRFVGVPGHWMRSSQARWIPLSIFFARAINRLEKEFHFDLIHFTDAREAFFTKTRAYRIGTVNDTYSAKMDRLSQYRMDYSDWWLRWSYYRLVHTMEAACLPHLDAIIANSDNTARVIAEQYHIHPNKVHRCYLCAQIEEFQPAVTLRHDYSSHPPRIICVGGNLERKGIHAFLQAAKIVNLQLPETEYWIVGQDPNIPMLEKECAGLGLTDRIHFLGLKSRAELIDLYAQANIFVMPSLIEAFGIVFLEAMAAGLPVIGTSVGGIPEIIQDQVNGRLVPPRNPTILAETILGLLRSSQLQEQFRQAGLERVKDFASKNALNCTYRVYEGLLSQ